MKLSQAINAVLQRQDLNSSEMTEVMRTIMTGGATDAQIGGFFNWSADERRNRDGDCCRR